MSDLPLCPPPLERQPAHDYRYPASWADLAEDDPEMQLMGPPPLMPAFFDPEWAAPKKKARPRCVTIPTTVPFTNAYEVLNQLDRPQAPRPEARVARPWPSAPSPPTPESSHRSAALSEPSSQEPSAIPPSSTPPARID